MLFFPYKPDLDSHKLPILTILVMVACIILFYTQQASIQKNKIYTAQFCAQKFERNIVMLFNKASEINSDRVCVNILNNLEMASNKEIRIDDLVRQLEPYKLLGPEESIKFNKKALTLVYKQYRENSPNHILDTITYDPKSFSPLNMIVPSFSHADLMHLIGNLLFFYAFSVTAELVLGFWRYLFAFVLIGLGCNLFYAFLSLNDPLALPTLGLSGIVMGMMALKAYLIPGVRVKCFFWFLVIFKRFLIPAWLLAIWYIGWDSYYLVTDSGSPQVNLAAHVGGAMTAMIVALVFFRKSKLNIVER